MKTEFASPERATPEELAKEIRQVKDLPLVKDMSQILIDAFVILNRHRQIVYCNDALLALIGKDDPESIYGLRLGEALHCIHAYESDGGCGTSRSCRQCGAVQAMVDSLAAPVQVKEKECRLTAGDEHHSFEFGVRVKTLEISGQMFTLVMARDTSHEKRRNALERIFFHDILNTAGGLRGVIELMANASEEDLKTYIRLAGSSSGTLIEEIHAQKEILEAEKGDLEPTLSRLNSLDIIQSVISVYQNHPIIKGKTIRISESTEAVGFTSDPILLVRVLGNMMKNALEAEPRGRTLTIGVEKIQDHVEFWVHNASVMPEEIRLQVFKRSFSTKGIGRGLGTYSIKLLGERYLNGAVTFSSEEGKGTVFSIRLPLTPPDFKTC